MNNIFYDKLIFELSKTGRVGYSLPDNGIKSQEVPAKYRRAQDAQLPECDELTVIRHYVGHSGNNFGVENGFYPLGSCTMKYNPVINEEIASLNGFTRIHPLQPIETCQGVLKLYDDLQKMLSEINGMHEFTLNPFAGAQGELTGLMIIRAYHESRKDHKRRKVLIPDSAHGTNPSSAVMCGLEVVEIKSTKDGMIDMDDLKSKVNEETAAIMMTNPNTLGLFETNIPEITELIHKNGGLLYYDGANLNPLLGTCRPGDMGFDVIHLNLHKTFATPHGGGGPGAGPVGVRKGLEQFLPSPRVIKTAEGYQLEKQNHILETYGAPMTVGAFMGNFGTLVRACTYILSLGKQNIKNVGKLATLNANYVKESLKDVYELPIDKTCKHEVVFDGLKDKSTGVTTLDVAKRLLDYGYHAPTIYFPLLFHESMMIEPVETESKETLDAFIAIMRKIAEEAKNDPELVKTAPHHTPIARVNDVLAAKHPILTYKQLSQGHE